MSKSFVFCFSVKLMKKIVHSPRLKTLQHICIDLYVYIRVAVITQVDFTPVVSVFVLKTILSNVKKLFNLNRT